MVRDCDENCVGAGDDVRRGGNLGLKKSIEPGADAPTASPTCEPLGVSIPRAKWDLSSELVGICMAITPCKPRQIHECVHGFDNFD